MKDMMLKIQKVSGSKIAMPAEGIDAQLLDFDNHIRWIPTLQETPRTICANSLAQADALRDLFIAKRSVEQYNEPLCSTSDIWTLTHLSTSLHRFL